MNKKKPLSEPTDKAKLNQLAKDFRRDGITDLRQLSDEKSEEFFNALHHYAKICAENLALSMKGIVAEDAASEATINVLKNFETFRGDSEFTSWFYRIILNICKSQRRQSSSKYHVNESNLNTLELSNFEGIDNEQPVDRLLKDELINQMNSSLDELNKNHKEILTLRYLSGEEKPPSYEDVAKTLQIPTAIVRTRLFRAKATLLKIMQEYTQDDHNPTTALVNSSKMAAIIDAYIRDNPHCMDDLDAKCQAIAQKVIIEGKTAESIAQESETTPNLAKIYLSRIRKHVYRSNQEAFDQQSVSLSL